VTSWFHDGLLSAGAWGIVLLFGLWAALIGVALLVVARSTRTRRTPAPVAPQEDRRARDD
jgi:uncharacterized membrane protein